MNDRVQTSAPIVRHDFRVQSSSTRWLTLHLHEVAPAEGASRAVLLIHGATLSGYIFDPPSPAPSWQARLAARGWASYALDARGFGRSTRPVTGDAGFDQRRPFGRAVEGIPDVVDALHFVRARHDNADITLVGFSWGTILAGCFAAAFPDAAGRLILYAPVYAEPNSGWIDKLCDPRNRSTFNPAFGAYRWTTAQDLRERWDADIPVTDKKAWRAPEVLEAMFEGALASEPLSCNRTPPAFSSPNGPFEDLFYACSGQPLYDASAIRIPTLIVRGDSDTTATDSDARRLLRDLGSRIKRYRTVSQGSHFVSFERSAPLLHEVCEKFLETPSGE